MSHTETERRGTRIYTRVSTVAQTLERQQAALDAANVVKTFSDTMSGARDDGPGLAELLSYVREGDTVVVWKLDRLGRNTLHILETVKARTDRGVSLVSVTDGIGSSTGTVKLVRCLVAAKIGGRDRCIKVVEGTPVPAGDHRPLRGCSTGCR